MTPTDRFVEALAPIVADLDTNLGYLERKWKYQIRQAVEAFAHAVCPDEQHCETCECDEDYHNDDFPHIPDGNTHRRLCIDPLLKRVMNETP